MNTTATTVGTYLRDLPPDRRVAMARVCSMIRRSARGVRESMRYGLAFYELDGPLFALESGRRHMSLYVAEQEVVVKHKEALPGVNTARSFVKFSDLNRLPLDVVEKIVRDSVAARRTRAQQGLLPTQAELLKLWAIKGEAAQIPAPAAKLTPTPLKPAVAKVTPARTAETAPPSAQTTLAVPPEEAAPGLAARPDSATPPATAIAPAAALRHLAKINTKATKVIASKSLVATKR